MSTRAKTKAYSAAARRRTQERIHRLAYDFEHMARRARAAGYNGLADALSDRASSLGDLARLHDDLWGL